jgi:1-acyl-sn-glycerol-3-phosphate acyltransferase
MTLDEAHERTRTRGVSRPVYALVRALLTPVAKVLYRLQAVGVANVPEHGPAILAPNHKSLYDPFLIGLTTKRHLYFMAKSELFAGRYGGLLSRLGAFPVQRGMADAQALETARILLEQGHVIALFPEGTRVRDPDALSTPRRGAGRLALETGAPIVPCAITGTNRLPRPARVQVAFAPPITPAELEATPEAAADLIDHQVWPQVEREFRRLRTRPTVIAAILATLSAAAGGGVAYRRRTQRKKKRRKLSLRR